MEKPKISPKISIVIPMFNEEENITPLFQRLFPVMENLKDTYEVIVVDDGSRDNTWEILKKEQEQILKKEILNSLHIISFARNFGQHTAILAGFESCQGQYVITMDADLQNPPEEIPKLIEKFQQGYDFVGTIRKNRQDSLFRKISSHLVNLLIQKISKIPLHDFGCMLRGYSHEIAKAIGCHKEYRTFLPALGSLYAKNPVEIFIDSAPRIKGTSKYSLFKLFSLLLDLMTGFSLWPLRFLFYLGFFLASLGITFGLLLFSLRLYYGAEWAVQGVFTLFAILFLLIGCQFIAFGLLGEYIGRIYQEVRERPYYIIKEKL